MRPAAGERRVTPEELAALAAEGTDAHRLWTTPRGWVDRFGDDFMVSAESEADGLALADRLPAGLAPLGLGAGRIFVRRLVKQPGEDDRPRQVAGGEAAPESTVAERGLRFGVDFSAGYSVGLFCDQRHNRAHLESLRPRRVLNCFAYTCAFSVAAARAGAETLSLDLSRRSLDRGRANLALNDLADAERHRFIADDVFAVLPRLARRGETFDAIILDPPTFSRGAKGRVFRVERDLGDLLASAAPLAAPGAHVLISTNARSLDARALRSLGFGGRRIRDFRTLRAPPEYPAGTAAVTAWIAVE